jgi:4-hydroxyproline epimerase
MEVVSRNMSVETERIRTVDSHTGGEPTRVIVDGGPNLGLGSLSARRDRFRTQFDEYRRAVVNEPRGSDVVVGALLCEPVDPSCSTGVIFFNNAGYLGMCGHGTMGVVVTLAHLDRMTVGSHHIETPIGVVKATYHGEGRVTVRNVPSYRLARDVAIDVDGYGRVVGDVAWGGNWFYLAKEHQEQLLLEQVDRLSDVAWRIRRTLQQRGITGADGAEIDHIELFGPPRSSAADSRNFVLCPGGAYDRSPCGTGTSAKLACLVADGQLAVGQTWRQESIVGSIFEGTVEIEAGSVIPSVTGSAYVTAESTLILSAGDPFRMGICE